MLDECQLLNEGHGFRWEKWANGSNARELSAVVVDSTGSPSVTGAPGSVSQVHTDCAPELNGGLAPGLASCICIKCCFDVEGFQSVV